jgi:esterase
MAQLDNFHFQIDGNPSGPKVVFLHGLLGSAVNWRKITAKFANVYHMLTYDQRGHGRSFQPTDGYAPVDYAADLHVILNELGWDKVFLVGHSMGARNALEFTHLYPERARGLVLEDIPATKPLENSSKTETMIRAAPVPFATRRAAKEFFLNDFVQMFRDRPQVEMLGQFFYANIVENEQGQGVWRFHMPGIIQTIRVGRSRDWNTVLKTLQVSTLLIRGSTSDELSHEDYQMICALNPLIQGVEIAPAGHWVHTDQPEQFCVAVENFIQSVKMLA